MTFYKETAESVQDNLCQKSKCI